MSDKIRPALAGIAFLLAGLLPAAAMATPEPWGLNFQAAATPVMERITEFHHMMLYIIIAIALFVLALLVYTVLRFNRRANPTPNRFAHNTLLEVVWTVIPIIILIIVAVPSFKLLYYGAKAEKIDLTVKAVGHQWYWSYEYPDHGGFTFDSRGIWDNPAVTKDQAEALIKEAAPKWLVVTPEPLRMLEVDNRMVVPVGKNVRVLTASADVIHSWAVAPFGVKKDAVPGRVNETWFRANKEGVYYGQCSQLCGANHAYMPIVVEAVSDDKFAAWVASHKTADAASGVTPTAPAAAAPATAEPSK